MRIDTPGQPWATVERIIDPERIHVVLDNTGPGAWLIVQRSMLHVVDRGRGATGRDAPGPAGDTLWGDA